MMGDHGYVYPRTQHTSILLDSALGVQLFIYPFGGVYHNKTSRILADLKVNVPNR